MSVQQIKQNVKNLGIATFFLAFATLMFSLVAAYSWTNGVGPSPTVVETISNICALVFTISMLVGVASTIAVFLINKFQTS